MKNALTRTKHLCIAQAQGIAAASTRLANVIDQATTKDAIEAAVDDATELRGQVITLGRHVKYLHRQVSKPVVNIAARAKQLGADVPGTNESLATWTIEAAAVLRSQGHDPISVGHHRNKLAWRDADGHTHTLVFDWYDKKSRCVRMYLDHYTEGVSKDKAMLLGISPYNLTGYTAVPPHVPSRLEMTTLPNEMSKALVWALAGRVGESPYEWVGFGNINIMTVAADTAYKAAWAKKLDR